MEIPKWQQIYNKRNTLYIKMENGTSAYQAQKVKKETQEVLGLRGPRV
jgi:hypothetical protein